MMWGVEVSDRWSCFSAGCPVSVVCVPWGEKALMLICMQRFEVIIGRWSDIVKHSHAFLFHACSMILWWSQSCKASWSRVGYLGIFGWIFSTKPWILYVLRFPCRHLWIFSWLCWAQAAQESSLLPVQPTKRSWFWNHKDFPHGFREVFSHDSSHTNLNVPPIWLRWKKKFHGLNRLNPKIPFLIPQTKIPKKNNPNLDDSPIF